MSTSPRAMLKHLDNMSDNDMVDRNVASGIPLVYELANDLKPIRHYYLGHVNAVARATAAVAAHGKT